MVGNEGDFFFVKGFRDLNEMLNLSLLDELVEMTGAVHVEDFSPRLVLRINREKDGVILKRIDPVRGSSLGKTQEKAGSIVVQLEDVQKVCILNQGFIGEIKKIATTVNGNFRIIFVVKQQQGCRESLLFQIFQGLFVGEYHTSNRKGLL